MPLSNQLTILIPTKARLNELSALLRYFERSHVQYRILILESGNTCRNLISEYSSLDLVVHEFDLHATLPQKLLAAAHLVQTPLVCFCTDDDLFLKEPMEQCAHFLLGHPEYSACQGYQALFSEKKSDFYLMELFHWYSPSLDADNPLQRLYGLMSNYWQVTWAVFRLETLIKMSQVFQPIQSPLFFEFFWSAMAVITGKVKRLPILYSLRRNDELQPFGHPLYLFVESPQAFFKEYVLYRQSLKAALGRDDQAIERILDTIHACFPYVSCFQKLLQQITQEFIVHPELSVKDPEFYKSIRIAPPMIQKKGGKTLRRNGRKYHLADKFLKPETTHGIPIEREFYLSLLDELDKYTFSQRNQNSSSLLNKCLRYFCKSI